MFLAPLFVRNLLLLKISSRRNFTKADAGLLDDFTCSGDAVIGFTEVGKC